MSETCCPVKPADATTSSRYRRVLWIALAVNLSMFVIELAASFTADSVSLLADAVDFAGDAANYGLSLGAIALGSLWQSRAAVVKGLSMGAYGVCVLVYAVWMLITGSQPEPLTMGIVGIVALAANVGVATILFAYREGNANMRSVWLCTRNDAIGNVAVLIAAAGVFGSGSAWPDLLIAALMSGLALSAAVRVLRQAFSELRPASGLEHQTSRLES